TAAGESTSEKGGASDRRSDGAKDAAHTEKKEGSAPAGEGPAKTKAPSPRQAIGPAGAGGPQPAGGARRQSKRADAPGGASQAAAIAPATEQKRSAAQATVSGMDEAKADQVRRDAFKASLKAAIERATPQPKTESEADRVQKEGATKASGALRGELT